MMEFINSIEFASPTFLWLIPVSLLTICLIFWFKPTLFSNSNTNLKNITQQHIRHPAQQWFKQYATEKQTQSKKLQFVFRSLGWSLLIILLHLSLAQPYRLGAKLPEPPQHRDIVFIIDTSVSMILDDYLVEGKRVSRMSMLQSVMQHFIEQLKGNRIGLIVFSEEVYTLAPLTSDYQLLQQQFNRLKPAVLTGRTSDPGKALIYTLNQFKEQTTEKPSLVLITDVNRPVSDIDPRVAATSLAQYGLRLHTVAIGAGSYAAENKQGSNLVYHPANYPLLKQIAEQGQGRFFSATDSRNIQQALLTIQQTEKREVIVEPQYIKLNLYYWPLLLAAIFISITQLYLSARRVT